MSLTLLHIEVRVRRIWGYFLKQLQHKGSFVDHFLGLGYFDISPDNRRYFLKVGI